MPVVDGGAAVDAVVGAAVGAVDAGAGAVEVAVENVEESGRV